MLISPFTPLFFRRGGGYGIKSRYIQTFARTDVLLLECLCSPGEQPDFAIVGQSGERPLVLSEWEINETTVLRYAEITGLEDGTFTIRERTSGLESSPFRFTGNNDELRGTTLFQYSMDSNRRRDDAVFFIAGMHRFFDFRVPGGFKDGEWKFAVDTEQFSTSHGDLVTLYALDTVQKVFTLGFCEGVSADFAEMLNRLLCCTYVYLDGERYERSGSSVPETTTLIEGMDSFIYKISLQKTTRLRPSIENANLVAIRRLPETTDYRGTEIGAAMYNLLTR